MNIVSQKECRICKGSLEEVLNLGTIYRSSFIREDEVVEEDQKAPLVLVKCENCGLVQLRDTIDLDVMYRQYWYSSSLNKSMVSSLKDIVNDVESRIELKDFDTVIDIGCNDGTLLNLYSNRELTTIGFDPALNLIKPSCSYFYNDYFTADNYFEIGGHVKAKVITAIAMFYDIPDPNNFVENVKQVLADDGLLVIQFTDLLSMFKATAFDNICHEHLEYYRLEDVVILLANHGLDVIDVSYNDVNGGSIRITACHLGAYKHNLVTIPYIIQERSYFADNTFKSFYNNIIESMLQTRAFLLTVKETKESIYLLGASTKGNTLLQVFGITNKDIPYAAEVNKDKFGLKTLGSNIEIIPEEQALFWKPDYFFCPIWHFEKSLLTKKFIRDYLEQGGKLVFPLPKFHTIGKEDLPNA